MNGEEWAQETEELLATAVAAARAGGEVLLPWFRRDEGSEAGELGGELEVEEKGRDDPVSRADRDSESAVVAEIHRRHPDHAILAEEGGDEATPEGAAEVEWVIDPLDGTSNFLRGLPVWCVSVGCRRRGELLAGAILDPLRGDLFTARRGGGARWNGRPMKVSSRPGLDGAFVATGFPFRARAALDRYLAAFRAVFLRAGHLRRCGSAGLDLAWTAAGVFDGFFEIALAPWDIAAGALLIREAGGTVTDLEGGADPLARGHVVAGAPGVHRELLAELAPHLDEEALARGVEE